MSGKKFKASAALVDRAKQYGVEEAIGLAKKTARTKFDETVDLAVRLGVDPKHQRHNESPGGPDLPSRQAQAGGS